METENNDDKMKERNLIDHTSHVSITGDIYIYICIYILLFLFKLYN